jgi:putative endonuclease
VARNWRCELGELDLVALDGDCLVFIEVKTRTSQAYGAPYVAVGPVKLARLRKLAAVFLKTGIHHAEHIRIDVISIVAGPSNDPVSLEHLRGVEA